MSSYIQKSAQCTDDSSHNETPPVVHAFRDERQAFIVNCPRCGGGAHVHGLGKPENATRALPYSLGPREPHCLTPQYRGGYEIIVVADATDELRRLWQRSRRLTLNKWRRQSQCVA